MLNVPAVKQLLEGSPYGWITESIGQTDNPIRFFRGTAASIPDLRKGWGVRRPVERGGGILSFEQFAREFRSLDPGHVLILRAGRGEGKTTFLRQLGLLLEREVLALRWDLRTSYSSDSPRLLWDLSREGIQMVLLAELEATDPAAVADRVAVRISNQRLPCPLLLAAAPAELTSSSFHGAEYIRFARLPAELADVLIDQLKKTLAIARETNINLDDHLPNLARFIDQPDAKIFCDEPVLLVALLKATYGTDFRDRLHREYRRLGELDPTAQQIYELVCYFDSVGSRLTRTFLSKLINIGSLWHLVKRFSNGTPWEIEEETVKSRNFIIAQTVVDQAQLLDREPFETFMKNVFNAASNPDLGEVETVRKLCAGYAGWDPVVPGAITKKARDLRGNLRGTIRTVIESSTTWLLNARNVTEASGDWGEAGSWGSMIYHLVPDDPKQSHIWLLKEIQAWLTIARRMYPTPLLHQVDYWESKRLLIESLIEGHLTKVRPTVLKTWVQLLAKGPLGTDFYFDLARHANDEAGAREDPEDMKRWYLVAARAFEHCLSRLRTPLVQIMYSMMLHNVLRKLGKEVLLDVLLSAWQTSIVLNQPNASTGTWYAQELAKSDPEEAIKVLKKVVANIGWGEALLTLSRIARDDHELREYTVDCFSNWEAKQGWISPLNTAEACHAVGIVYGYKKAAEHQKEWLGKALDNYELAAKSDLKKMWEIHGTENWRDAWSALQSINRQEAGVRKRKWQEAQEEFKTLPRF